MVSEIPEEKLMEDMTALLMETLPGELLKIEETFTDGQRLPALRYAGR